MSLHSFGASSLKTFHDFTSQEFPHLSQHYIHPPTAPIKHINFKHVKMECLCSRLKRHISRLCQIIFSSPDMLTSDLVDSKKEKEEG